MSVEGVEYLMGKPRRACWIYERAEHDYDNICFANGAVESIATNTPKPGTRDVFVDARFAGNAAPKPPSPLATEVSFWMGPAQVTKLKGSPTSIEAYYAKDNGEYYARFEKGSVVRFAPVSLRCVHGMCTPYIKGNDE